MNDTINAYAYQAQGRKDSDSPWVDAEILIGEPGKAVRDALSAFNNSEPENIANIRVRRIRNMEDFLNKMMMMWPTAVAEGFEDAPVVFDNGSIRPKN